MGASYSDLRGGNPEKNFTYYTDPGKIKNYLGCGLPILISNVPPIAVELDKNKCGAIIGNNPEDIAEKVVELLSDGESLKKYRENVLEYRKQFDWDYIFREL
ncbi:glycosyltransferase [Minisyncoccus archaeiphilus]|uniref:glycosyltransferase n=1 Tax=Minisyncoccus archaeiphilus TaxID=3238481 RepID=UPI00399D4D06